MADKTTFRFPFAANLAGRITSMQGDEAIRAKIIQVLFTAPGERVNKPEFGCGLFDLVFEPNNLILAAAMEFKIMQALNRWLEEDILVDTVKVDAVDETITIEIAYTKKSDLAQKAVRIHFK
jgi:phage baseplate assembly protein W